MYKLFIICFLLGLLACNESYTPKPRGYFRIEFPEKEYIKTETSGPFTFEIPKYSTLKADSSSGADEYWYNLEFPQLKGKLHLTYKNLNHDLAKYIEDSRTLAYKHTIMAEAISEQVFISPEKDIFGILYEIKGNAASPYQFFATDSLKHFLRGSLYFDVYPNKDSLLPVFEFIKPDITHLIETIEWK